MEKSQSYSGFTITWQEPPHTSEGWVFNIGSNDKRLADLIHSDAGQWVYVLKSAVRDGGIAEAMAWIDSLLSRRAT